uniref:Myb-like domain-containing protein n=1 Tax=Brassica oleracea var. oleracea TaxID=109376 RepID=A0A0D3CWA2_BRAOL
MTIFYWSVNPRITHLDVPKTVSNQQVSVKPITTNPTFLAKQPSLRITFPFYNNNHTTKVDTGFKPPSRDLLNNVSSLNLFSSSTSSSDEEEDQEKRSRKKRKYWKGLFTKLTKELMEKQEKMHKRFLKALESRERENLKRRSLEGPRGGQEQQPHQQNYKVSHRKKYQSEQHSVSCQVVLDTTMKIGTYNGNHSVSPCSSRWPKTEVEALIRIRKNLEANYLENGTKGPLWEEISAEMRRFGYNRSPKRCKEKWENINKYFKKVKESNKKRPLDSKTCPYFHQLEALYNERNKTGPLPILPLLVTQPRQFLLSQETKAQFETNQMDKVDNKEGESGEDDYEDEEEEGAGDNYEISEFEIVLNKTSSPMDINNNLFT